MSDKDDGGVSQVEDGQNDEGRFGIPPIEEIGLDEIRRLWQDLTDGGAHPPLHDELADFTMDLWNEIRRRTEVDQPECPECGSTRYSQNAGDPLHCVGCDTLIDHKYPDLTEGIHQNWQLMASCDDMKVREEAGDLVDTVTEEVSADD